MKKFLLRTWPILLSFTVVIASYLGFKPVLRDWLKSSISGYLASAQVGQVEVGSVNWQLVPPRFDLENIQIKSQNKIPEMQIQRLSAAPDFIALLFGEIYLAIVEAENISTKINLDLYQTESNDKKLPIGQLFEVLNKVPIRRFAIIDSKVELNSDRLKQTLMIENLNTLAVNRKRNLSVWLDIRDSKIIDTKGKQYPFSVQADATLTNESLELEKFKLNVFNSSISVKSKIKDIENLLINPKGNLQVQGFADLSLVYEALKEQIKLPKLTGNVQLSGDLDLENIFTDSKTLTVSTKNFGFDQFFLGDIDFEAQFKKNGIYVQTVNLTSEAFLAKIKDLKMTVKVNPLTVHINGKPELEFLDVHQLLVQVGVGDVPIENFISASMDCDGNLFPSMGLKCKVDSTGEALEIRSGNKASDTILRLKSFSALGEVQIDSHQVSFNSSLKVAENIGQVDGVVNYQKGFKINFQTESLDFKDVDNLANLKIEGIAAIQGFTEGGSKSAIFEMDLTTKSYAWFQNFGIGTPSGKMSYQSGVLKFNDVQGILNESPYNMDISINLRNGTINGNADFPKLGIKDALSALDRQFRLPVMIDGSGPVSVDFSGPMDLSKLSYSVDSRFSGLTAVGERFDELVFKANSDTAQMRIEEAYLIKNKAFVRMIGESNPKGEVDFKLVGDNFLLEELQNVVNLEADITGILDFSMSLSGHILSPDTRFYARLNNLTVADQEFPSSEVSIDFSKTAIVGSTSLIGQRLKSEFQIPLHADSPFRLSLFARSWNYASLFSLLGAGSLLQDYRSQVSGNLDLRSEKGGFFAASGQGEITDLVLQRGNLLLKNNGPMKLTMTNGQLRLENFLVSGDDSQFELKAPVFSSDNMQLRLLVDSQLRIFQILVPFLEDLGGRGKLQVNIDGSIAKPTITGNASIKDGFAKLKGFPHPLEKIESKVNFNQNKISISKLEGQLAGGSVNAGGEIDILGFQNIPTSIRAQLQNVSMNVPDKVKTNGDADLLFSGKWFPFTLSGTYRVNSGIFEKELEEESGTTSLRQSAYLPRVLLQSSFEPVLLDIGVILQNPLIVKNKMVDGSVKGNINVKGSPSRPILLGKINVERNSKLLVRDRVFEVLSASVDLDDPNEINPSLYATARTRVAEYDINLTVQGKAKDPILRMTSVPPLPDKDIISLLALGITSQKLEQKVDTKEQEQSTYAEIGTAILSNTPLFKSLQQDLGVQLQISTQYDNTSNNSVRKITVSRQLNEKVNASATRLTGQQNSSEVKLQYSLDDNISAVGTFESRESSEAGSTTDLNRQSQSIFGFDLDFRKEFR